MDFAMLLAGDASPLVGDLGLVALGAGLGAGLLAIGAGRGIGHLAGSAMDAIARNPQAGGRIQTAMIIAAALIEGFTFFGLIVCLLMALQINPENIKVLAGG